MQYSPRLRCQRLPPLAAQASFGTVPVDHAAKPKKKCKKRQVKVKVGKRVSCRALKQAFPRPKKGPGASALLARATSRGLARLDAMAATSTFTPAGGAPTTATKTFGCGGRGRAMSANRARLAGALLALALAAPASAHAVGSGPNHFGDPPTTVAKKKRKCKAGRIPVKVLGRTRCKRTRAALPRPRDADTRLLLLRQALDVTWVEFVTAAGAEPRP